MVSTTMKKSQPICFTEDAEFLRVNVSMSDKVKKLKKKKIKRPERLHVVWQAARQGVLFRVIIRQITVSRA